MAYLHYYESVALTIHDSDFQTAVEARARSAGISVEDYLKALVQDDDQWGEIPASELDPDTRAGAHVILKAITEALEDVDSENTTPAQAVFSELRGKYGLPRGGGAA